MTNHTPERHDVRFAISAKILAVDAATGNRCEGEVDNISRGGCFVRTADPLLVWSQARVWVVYRGQQFEAEASVTHARPGFGMGLSFATITAENQAVLDAWIRELSR